MNTIARVRKRTGKLVDFDTAKIRSAILRAMKAVNQESPDQAAQITASVVQELKNIKRQFHSFVPDVEGIQDIVERCLMLARRMEVAKAYILYREQRAKFRESTRKVSAQYQALAEESSKYFDSVYSELVYLRSYARWIPAENRRETWIETVDRFINFMRVKAKDAFTDEEYATIRTMILTQQVMPSMRLLQFAGPAAMATNVCAYNCAFIAPSSIRDFSEALYVLMCGTGLGFSVESQCIQQLPQVAIQTGDKIGTHQVADSREGWAEALRVGMECWYSGKDLDFDYSLVRPAGARLKTFGGKSSGPGPLRNLLDFTRDKILKNQGGRLKSIDVHDILCKQGQIVIVGGVRRSAEMSLSDLNDTTMREAKSGYFYINEPQRSMANNSVVYKSKPSNREFLREWLALVDSGSGERGIFNRGGLIETLPTRRLEHLEQDGYVKNGRIVGILGTNPCGEIILKGSGQFCNLSEIICRADDTSTTLAKKLRVATMIGTFQSSLTNFPYLSPKWQKNCESERLLGVSLTGQWDCSAVRSPELLHDLREQAIAVNLEYAKRLKLSPSTAITAVKPSGTVSQLVNCASGMHPRFAPYYIRRIRISANDALCQLLKDQGVPCSPEVGQSFDSATTWVMEFPIKSPEASIYQSQLSAIEQLEYWKTVKCNFTEHNPSVTIYVGDSEWIAVANWVTTNWDFVGGVSFLPKLDTVYQLAPYEEISKERYEELALRVAQVDLAKLPLYELEDQTEVKNEFACVGTNCELS